MFTDVHEGEEERRRGKLFNYFQTGEKHPNKIDIPPLPPSRSKCQEHISADAK